MLLYEGEKKSSKKRQRVYATLQLAPISVYHSEHATKGSPGFDIPVCFSQIIRRELDGRKLVSGYSYFALYNIANQHHEYEVTPKGVSRYDFLDEYRDPAFADKAADDVKYAKMTRIDWCAQRILGHLHYVKRDIRELRMISEEESARLKNCVLRALMVGESSEECMSYSKGADDLKWQADNLEEILEWLYEKGLIK